MVNNLSFLNPHKVKGIRYLTDRILIQIKNQHPNFKLLFQFNKNWTQQYKKFKHTSKSRTYPRRIITWMMWTSSMGWDSRQNKCLDTSNKKCPKKKERKIKISPLLGHPTFSIRKIECCNILFIFGYFKSYSYLYCFNFCVKKLNIIQIANAIRIYSIFIFLF